MTNNFIKLYKRWGFRKAVYSSLMNELGNLFGFHIAILNTRQLGNVLEPVEVPQGYELKILDPEELAKAAQQPELDMSAQFIAKAVLNGGYCAAVIHQGNIVSYVWRAYESTPIHDRLLLNFAPPLRYGYKALTLPSYRGLHLQHAITLHTESKDRAAGYAAHLSFIETHNYPSIVSDARRGNEVVGYLVWINNRFINWAYTTKSAQDRNISTRLV